MIVRATDTGDRSEFVRIVNDVDRLAAVMARAGEAPEDLMAVHRPSPRPEHLDPPTSQAHRSLPRAVPHHHPFRVVAAVCLVTAVTSASNIAAIPAATLLASNPSRPGRRSQPTPD